MSWQRTWRWLVREKKTFRAELEYRWDPRKAQWRLCAWERGERVEEWRDRKYWPQMLSETWPWLFRSAHSDLVTATCHKHTLIYTWSFPRGTSGQDLCLHCGWDKDLFRTSLCLSSYSHSSVTTVPKVTHCRRVLDWSNTNKVGLIIFKPTVVQEFIWNNKGKQTTAQALSHGIMWNREQSKERCSYLFDSVQHSFWNCWAKRWTFLLRRDPAITFICQEVLKKIKEMYWLVQTG